MKSVSCGLSMFRGLRFWVEEVRSNVKVAWPKAAGASVGCAATWRLIVWWDWLLLVVVVMRSVCWSREREMASGLNGGGGAVRRTLRGCVPVSFSAKFRHVFDWTPCSTQQLSLSPRLVSDVAAVRLHSRSPSKSPAVPPPYVWNDFFCVVEKNGPRKCGFVSAENAIVEHCRRWLHQSVFYFLH